ncbi:putative reverse transcriptase domain-containing protein [Tanacetum coccineum]
MPLLTYLNLGLGELAHTKLTVELADKTVKYPKGIAKNVLVRIGKFTFPIDFIILDMPEDIKVPLILRRPFLSTARAKIDVYKRKITLRVGEENIIFKSVKSASSLIKRVYMLSLRERMELNLEARLMGETLVRNQGDDLMPTIKEGEVIEEFRTRDKDLDTGIHDYPSYCDNDKKIHIDYAYNLKFSCMIGFEFTHVNFFPLLYVNVMSKKFHNSIMKYKMVYKGDNVVGALMNVPIFVGTFSVVTDFAVLEDMDAYRDEGMGDVIVGKPFLSEVRIKARWFYGMTTIYNGPCERNIDEVSGMHIFWNSLCAIRARIQTLFQHTILLINVKKREGKFEDNRFAKSITEAALVFTANEGIVNMACLSIPSLRPSVLSAVLLRVSMEYLVNIRKRRAFWSLNEDILKITILNTNTPYPSRKIQRICACTHQRPQRNKAQYAVSRRSQYAVSKI